MRLQWAFVLGAAAISAQAQLLAPQPAVTTALARRQDTGDDPSQTSSAPPEQTSDSGDDGNNNGGDSTSAGGDDSTSQDQDPSSTSDSGGSDEEDSTVFVTRTVTDGNADTITQRTTVRRTSTFTVVVVSTIFQTKTVTEEGDTATKTIYETSTVIDNDKRDLNFGLRTLPIVEAYATEAPVPTVTSVDWQNLDMARKKMQRDNVFDKRATVTETRTVTVGEDSETTVVNTVTQTVVTTRSTATTTTKVVTETERENAKTTETVTSTLTVTSTGVTTGVQTTTGASDDNDSSGSSSGDDSSGLSTGAKAGIGAGVGVAGLLILGALVFFCMRRRRRGPKADPDAMAGASEVPVGGPGRGSTPPMSHQASTHHAAAAGLLAPHGRPQPTKPSPEGYRGTAMGDGRAGYAKPAPYGAAYAQPTSTSPTNRSSTLNSTSPFSPSTAGGTVSSMGADSLPAHPAPGDHQAGGMGGAAELGNDTNTAGSRWHPSGNATEMDAQGVGHQSSALPQDVYEMPAQNYR
ncbi:hypothetical protein LIA77_06403 [Sarocladium implicatum]|nr:hypothetical protein LIA77_06403 [Sarocladium implicatum]